MVRSAGRTKPSDLPWLQFSLLLSDRCSLNVLKFEIRLLEYLIRITPEDGNDFFSLETVQENLRDVWKKNERGFARL